MKLPEEIRIAQLMVNDFSKLLDEQLFTDLSITTSDKVTLKVHKSVIATRAPAFFSMMGEATATGCVNLPDLTSAVLGEMLKFIYGNRESYREVWGLIVAAEKYSIAELKDYCIDHVIANLSNETIFQALALTESMPDMKQLFEKAVDYVVL